MRDRLAAAVVLTVLPLSALAASGTGLPEDSAPNQSPAFHGQTRAKPTEKPSGYRLEVVTSGLKRPWGLAFLPDGRMMVSEREGVLRLVNPGGEISAPIAGVPPVVTGGTGGLLDLTLDPDFSSNHTLYFAYLEPQGAASTLAIARARIDGDRGPLSLSNVEVIFRARPAERGRENVGCSLLFGMDGRLYASLGDRFQNRDAAQDLQTDLGKIIRINPDGSIPADNPFANVPDVLPEIFAYGVRNPEGLALDPATGAIWEVENGAKGGDELNLLKPGANYGWPVITYGRDYNDSEIGVGTARVGMEQPIYYWDPSIAPAGMALYDGRMFPEWSGNLFVASLKGRHVSRLVLRHGMVLFEENILEELHSRIRNVSVGPDGALYVLTDEEQGRLVRVVPNQPKSVAQGEGGLGLFRGNQ